LLGPRFFFLSLWMYLGETCHITSLDTQSDHAGLLMWNLQATLWNYTVRRNWKNMNCSQSFCDELWLASFQFFPFIQQNNNPCYNFAHDPFFLCHPTDVILAKSSAGYLAEN
jgi:hypothetical protein